MKYKKYYDLIEKQAEIFDKTQNCQIGQTWKYHLLPVIKNACMLADKYGAERLELTTLGINSSDVNVTCQFVHTGIGRAYVKVTVTNQTDFFLSDLLEGVGIYDGNGFSAVSYAECTDMTAYASTVNFSNYTAEVLSPISGIGKIYNNIKSIFDKLKN